MNDELRKARLLADELLRLMQAERDRRLRHHYDVSEELSSMPRVAQDLVAALAAQPVTAQGAPIHIRMIAASLLRQLEEPFPREELDLEAVGAIARFAAAKQPSEAAPTPADAQDHRGRPEQRSDPTASEEALDRVLMLAWRSGIEHSYTVGNDDFRLRGTKASLLKFAAALSTHPAEGEQA